MYRVFKEVYIRNPLVFSRRFAQVVGCHLRILEENFVN